MTMTFENCSPVGSVSLQIFSRSRNTWAVFYNGVVPKSHRVTPQSRYADALLKATPVTLLKNNVRNYRHRNHGNEQFSQKAR
uniref:Uncharacterized protein n=1 Tax=Anguilla anguilla TaxID=7936 RepID=A0A0E9X2N6_ANGAN